MMQKVMNESFSLLKNYFWILFLLLVVGCSKDESAKNSLPTLAEFQKIELITGERNSELTLGDGTAWQYRISVPELPQNTKVPLLINLHWSGDYNSYIESMRCLVEPAFKDSGYIIFSPRIGFGENWFAEETRERILAFLDLAIDNWPIDRNKIAVTGYSLGGTGCWNYALTHDDYFSAAIPMAGAYIADKKINIPMAVIHGTDDELYDYDLAVGSIDDSIAMGSDIILITAEGRSHQQACLYMPYLMEAAQWLENEVWN
jgi:poly(3-hydroxybutyrate) depolymerase